MIKCKHTYHKRHIFLIFVYLWLHWKEQTKKTKQLSIFFWKLFLLLVQHPTRSQPVGQYSKGHAPPYQSPAATEEHTQIVIIMTPWVPSVLYNLAGVLLAAAPPTELDHLLSANSSYRLHSHCWVFLIGLRRVGYWWGCSDTELWSLFCWFVYLSLLLWVMERKKRKCWKPLFIDCRLYSCLWDQGGVCYHACIL